MRVYLYLLFLPLFFTNCSTNTTDMADKEIKVLYLHHSTGYGVWRGDVNRYVFRLTKKGAVQKYLEKYDKKHGVNYSIQHQAFPKTEPYGWKNYPYDYYNIWVKHAGDQSYMEEPTLEMLTKQYDVIVFKHCFPVSSIKADEDTADINSEVKTLANYKLQYKALKEKLHQFPKTKFIVWTGAALTEANSDIESAKRAEEFANWVKGTWNEDGDNIFLWDFRELEVEGGLYLKEDYASGPTNSHPNRQFNEKAAGLFVNRLADIIENNGKNTDLLGNPLK